MKRFLYVFLSLILTLMTFTACTATVPVAAPEETAPIAMGVAPERTPPPASAAPVGADLTLAQIKKAALDAGYIVSDGHQYILMEDIIGGITIEIVAYVYPRRALCEGGTELCAP